MIVDHEDGMSMKTVLLCLDYLRIWYLLLPGDVLVVIIFFRHIRGTLFCNIKNLVNMQSIPVGAGLCARDGSTHTRSCIGKVVAWGSGSRI